MNTTVIIVGIVGFVAGYAITTLLGMLARKKAGKESKRIIEDANKQAETIKKEAQLMAKSELYEMRSKFEQERDEKSRGLQKFEQRLIQKEETMDKRMETLDKKEHDIETAEKKLEADNKILQVQREEVAVLRESEIKELERIAAISRDEAKELLLRKVADDARDEAEQTAKRIKEEILDRAEVEATKIIVEAIQRTAVDTVSDHTVSVVSLPNDEMKGRIIGREGRNIRTLQQVTGVDIIIDDTPEAVTLSSFDPIRREIARLSLEKLVQDGRIHPGRIEEIVDKTRKDVERKFKEDGEKTILDLNIAHVHPEVVRLLGRLKHRTSYGQNVLQHSIEVAIIMGVMAGELKLNVELAKRIGLLHDLLYQALTRLDARSPAYHLKSSCRTAVFIRVVLKRSLIKHVKMLSANLKKTVKRPFLILISLMFIRKLSGCSVALNTVPATDKTYCNTVLRWLSSWELWPAN